MIYLPFVATGIVLAAIAARFVPNDTELPAIVAARVRVSALVGAVLGAYLFELPADLLHLAARTSHAGAPLFGRTVLGGMLGGWGAVEWTKWRLGFRGATGDRFALPLAIALACGRLGCVFAGCCAGVRIAASSPWARVSLATSGEARFPAALLEAWFHGLAAMALVAAAVAGAARGRRLAIYLTVYACVRFALEWVRDSPRALGPLTYYQLLAIALFALAAATWWRRASRSFVPVPMH